MMIIANENELIFNVKKYKPVYQQLITNPNVELCFYSKELGTQVRINGKVHEIYNDVIIDKILFEHPDLNRQIEKYGKDVISLFAIQKWKATMWNNKDKEKTIDII